MDTKLLQPANADPSIVIMEGIFTVVKPEHPVKALNLITVAAGIFTLIKFLQLAKAAHPIFLTLGAEKFFNQTAGI
jgi:hypothetical protein